MIQKNGTFVYKTLLKKKIVYKTCWGKLFYNIIFTWVRCIYINHTFIHTRISDVNDIKFIDMSLIKLAEADVLPTPDFEFSFP